MAPSDSLIIVLFGHVLVTRMPSTNLIRWVKVVQARPCVVALFKKYPARFSRGWILNGPGMGRFLEDGSLYGALDGVGLPIFLISGLLHIGLLKRFF